MRNAFTEKDGKNPKFIEEKKRRLMDLYAASLKRAKVLDAKTLRYSLHPSLTRRRSQQKRANRAFSMTMRHVFIPLSESNPLRLICHQEDQHSISLRRHLYTIIPRLIPSGRRLQVLHRCTTQV